MGIINRNRPLFVYIASPYTKGDQQQNVDNAIDASERISAMGHIPYNPLLTHYWELRHHHPYRFWMDIDLAWLAKCDCILRLPGESHGADEEVEYAEKHAIVVLHDVTQLPKAWADAT
jgi:hypothetical protein